jgi:microcystin-dependent protein
MTISSIQNEPQTYSGNGVATQFAFPFKVPTEDSIKVFLTDADGNITTLTRTSDYTVTNHNTEGSGYVTLNTAPATNITITIEYDMDFIQSTDLTTGGVSNPYAIERQFDITTAQIKQLAGIISSLNISSVSTQLANLSTAITQGDATTLASANAYTDTEINNAVISSGAVTTQYVDDGDTNTLSSANQYTDDQIALIPTPTLNQIGDMKHGQLQQASHDGWLLWQEGVNLDKTTYADLWAWAQTNSLDGAVGTAGKFFVDIDANNFQLHGLSGRVLGSSGSGSGLTGRSFGDKAGAETHTLVEAELPSHKHGIFNNNLSNLRYGLKSVSPVLASTFGTVAQVTTSSVSVTETIGGDQPHNNMQPTTFLNSFIYVGV